MYSSKNEAVAPLFRMIFEIILWFRKTMVSDGGFDPPTFLAQTMVSLIFIS